MLYLVISMLERLAIPWHCGLRVEYAESGRPARHRPRPLSGTRTIDGGALSCAGHDDSGRSGAVTGGAGPVDRPEGVRR